MVADDVHCLVSVLLIQLDSAVWRHAMRCQKGNDITSPTRCQIGIIDFFEFCLADTRNGEQLFRLTIQYLKRAQAKQFKNLFGCFGSNPLDLSRTQVSNNTLLAMRNDLVETLNFKLDAMLRVAIPTPVQVIAQVFCCRQAVAHRLDLGDAVSCAIHNFFAGPVECDHIAGIIHDRILWENEFYEFTYQDTFSFRGTINCWSVEIRLCKDCSIVIRMFLCIGGHPVI